MSGGREAAPRACTPTTRALSPGFQHPGFGACCGVLRGLAACANAGSAGLAADPHCCPAAVLAASRASCPRDCMPPAARTEDACGIPCLPRHRTGGAVPGARQRTRLPLAQQTRRAPRGVAPGPAGHTGALRRRPMSRRPTCTCLRGPHTCAAACAEGPRCSAPGNMNLLAAVMPVPTSLSTCSSTSLGPGMSSTKGSISTALVGLLKANGTRMISAGSPKSTANCGQAAARGASAGAAGRRRQARRLPGAPNPP